MTIIRIICSEKKVLFCGSSLIGADVSTIVLISVDTTAVSGGSSAISVSEAFGKVVSSVFSSDISDVMVSSEALSRVESCSETVILVSLGKTVLTSVVSFETIVLSSEIGVVIGDVSVSIFFMFPFFF